MDFIAVLGNLPNDEVNEIKKSIEHLGFSFLEDKDIDDPELNEGLSMFLKKIEYSFILQIIMNKNDASSAKVSEDIQNYSLYQKDSTFLNWLVYLDSLPIFSGKNMYILFASEWSKEDIELRFYKSASISTVLQYFKINNGWTVLYFNSILGSEVFEENIPLLFRVQFGKPTLL